MTMEDFVKMLEPALDDASDAEEYLENNSSSQFARRVYIRSVFAYIEGAVWVLKTACLNAKPKHMKERKVTVAEIALLIEESYQLKENGKIRKVKTNLGLLENIKFTFKYINHLFNGSIDLLTEDEIWQQFKKAKEIRNRLTHPKLISDYDISDEEIKFCQNSFNWFTDLTRNAFDLMIVRAGVM